MDRNTLIGLVLIFGILAGSFYMMKPTEQELKQEQRLQDSLKRVREGLPPISDTVSSTNTQATVDTTAVLNGAFGSARLGEEQIVTLENELIIAKISSKGGQVKSVQLKNEENYDGNALMIIDEDQNSFGFIFRADGENINTSDLHFTPQGGDITLTGESAQSISFRLNYSETQYLEYTYSIKGNDYNLGLDVNAVGIQNLMDIKTSSIGLHWETTLLRKELNAKSERERSTIFYRELAGDVDNLSETSDDKEKVDDQLNWIAFKQHFFSAAMISDQPLSNSDLSVAFDSNEEIVKHYKATADLAFSAQQDNHYTFNFFFGPNQYKVLKAQGDDLQQIIKMGWGPMGWINKFITVPIFDVLDGLHLGYGIIILILTLILKGALFPLTYRSYQSMAKMRVLKPQIDEIKEKVGDDNPMLLQQETMKLYKQAGVNPLGGCLPLLLQMPFTLAFFFFFPNLFELRGEGFLWVKDLSTYDAPITFSPIFGIGHISFMCILMTLTTLLTTWYNNATSGAAANNQMKYIGYFMPLIFFFVLNSFPAGLNYYYFLSAVLTFLTQVIIRQFIDDDKILAKIEEHKKSPKSQKKSSFQQKMEEMMRQQQAQQKNKKK